MVQSVYLVAGGRVPAGQDFPGEGYGQRQNPTALLSGKKVTLAGATVCHGLDELVFNGLLPYCLRPFHPAKIQKRRQLPVLFALTNFNRRADAQLIIN